MQKQTNIEVHRYGTFKMGERSKIGKRCFYVEIIYYPLNIHTYLAVQYINILHYSKSNIFRSKLRKLKQLTYVVYWHATCKMRECSKKCKWRFYVELIYYLLNMHTYLDV